MRVRGFTLIELIVAVTLILLLSGLLIAGYTGFHDTQLVRQAASTVISNLQSVRTQATSGVKPVGCDTLVGYTVSFPTASTYTASALCLVGGSEETAGAVTSYALPPSVLFSPVPSPITFYALDRGASSDQTITIVGNTTTVRVSVFSSGVVSQYVPTPTP